jgi:hypothetical protein
MTKNVLHSIGTAVFALGCAVAMPSLAAAQAPASPASMTGTWTVSLIGDHVIPVALVLEQNGPALKGTFIMMGKEFPVTGETTGKTFTVSGKGPAFGRGNDHAAGAAAAPPAGPQRPGPAAELADMTINGTADGDGGYAGEFISKMGDRRASMKWTAERLKERKAAPQAAASIENLNVTGAWTMTIPEAQLQVTMDLKQDGTKVTGSASSDHLGAMKLEGTFVNGTLSFVTTGSTGGQEIRIEYSGKYTAAGTFAGDLTSPMGAMTWTAARVKK